jgi:GH18 family chitinase
MRTLLTALLVAFAAASASAVELIGYVPDYRMSDANYVNNVLPAQLGMLDEVRYFGITVTASGGLTTTAANLAHINTIKQKIAQLPEANRPRLDLTLGGAGEAAGFAAVAQNAGLRTQLAQNVNALLDQTGAIGVDVDWEHPAEGAQLTTHYPALLASIKQEIGASRRVYATVSPEKMLPRSVFDGPNAVDGVSIMTYDIGWWANDPADPNLNQHSLQQYVEDTVDAWTNPAGTPIPRTWVFGSKRSIAAPADKLGVGSPFYARGYNGSSQNLAVPYRNLAGLASPDGNAYQYNGANVWLPGKAAIAERIEYAHDEGLQHVIFWEMWHDLPPTHADSLLRAAYETRNALAASTGDFNADGAADGADLDVWRLHFSEAVNATFAKGDADGNGAIDSADFLLWQRHVLGAAAQSSSVAVPEPAGFLLFPLGWAALVFHARAACL